MELHKRYLLVVLLATLLWLNTINHVFEQLEPSPFVPKNTDTSSSSDFINNSEYIINESSGIYQRVFNQSRNLSKMSQEFNCIIGTLLCYSVNFERLDVYQYSENLSVLSQDSIQFLNEYNNSNKKCQIGLDTVRKESNRSLVFITSHCRFIHNNMIYTPNPHFIFVINYDNSESKISLINLTFPHWPNAPEIIPLHSDTNIPVVISHSFPHRSFLSDTFNASDAYTFFIDPLNEHQIKKNFSLLIYHEGFSTPECTSTVASVNNTSTELLLYCSQIQLLNKDGEVLHNFSSRELIKLTVNTTTMTVTPLLNITTGEEWYLKRVFYLGSNRNTVTMHLMVGDTDYIVNNLVEWNSASIELMNYGSFLILFDLVNNTVKVTPAPETQIFNSGMYRPLDSIFTLRDGTIAMISRWDHFQNYEYGVNLTGEIDPICTEWGPFDGTPYNKGALRLSPNNQTWSDLQCSYQDVRNFQIPFPDAIVMISNSGRIIYEVNHTGNDSFSLISVPWVTAELPIDNEAQQLASNNSTSGPGIDLNNSENETLIDGENNGVNDSQNTSNSEDIIPDEQSSADSNLSENTTESLPDEIDAIKSFQINWKYIFVVTILAIFILAGIAIPFRKKQSKDPWN